MNIVLDKINDKQNKFKRLKSLNSFKKTAYKNVLNVK